MADASASKAQRYSVWVGKRNAPLKTLGEIGELLKSNDFDVEVHSRNWDGGGYIVSWENFSYCFSFSFAAEASFSCLTFWFPYVYVFLPFWFLQVFKVNNDLKLAWNVWNYFHNYGFYMGSSSGPTVETSGSIVLAPQPQPINDNQLYAKSGPPQRPVTPPRPGSGKVF